MENVINTTTNNIENEKAQELVVRRGDIFYADLGSGEGVEQEGVRPVIIVQNNIGNKHSPAVIVVPVATRIRKFHMPTHTFLGAGVGNLHYNSMALAEQVRTISKSRLKNYIGHLGFNEMLKVNYALAVSLGLAPASDD